MGLDPLHPATSRSGDRHRGGAPPPHPLARSAAAPARIRDGPAGRRARGHCPCAVLAACSPKGFREAVARAIAGGRFGEVARAAADPLPQVRQLGGQGGELIEEFVVLPPESLNLLLLSQDQLSGTCRPRQPVSIWNPSRRCAHHRKYLPEMQAGIKLPSRVKRGRCACRATSPSVRVLIFFGIQMDGELSFQCIPESHLGLGCWPSYGVMLRSQGMNWKSYLLKRRCWPTSPSSGQAPLAHCCAASSSLPATQGQRSRLGQGFCFRSDSGGCGAGFLALTAGAQRGGGTVRWSGRGGASVLCASVPPAAQRSS